MIPVLALTWRVASPDVRRAARRQLIGLLTLVAAMLIATAALMSLVATAIVAIIGSRWQVPLIVAAALATAALALAWGRLRMLSRLKRRSGADDTTAAGAARRPPSY